MSPRPATLDDYRWLYTNDPTYMPDGLKCAREIMLDIVERCPATFLDVGCGRGHLVDWINTKTTGEAFGIDKGSGREDPWIGQRDWMISCDVFEHLDLETLDRALSEATQAIRKGLLLTIANMSDVHTVAGEAVELHLIQKPFGWWIDRIKAFWPTAYFTHREINCHRFALIVEF
jgi:hypothetical protein